VSAVKRKRPLRARPDVRATARHTPPIGGRSSLSGPSRAPSRACFGTWRAASVRGRDAPAQRDDAAPIERLKPPAMSAGGTSPLQRDLSSLGDEHLATDDELQQSAYSAHSSAAGTRPRSRSITEPALAGTQAAASAERNHRRATERERRRRKESRFDVSTQASGCRCQTRSVTTIPATGSPKIATPRGDHAALLVDACTARRCRRESSRRASTCAASRTHQTESLFLFASADSRSCLARA
jgi:hypothetical protein